MNVTIDLYVVVFLIIKNLIRILFCDFNPYSLTITQLSINRFIVFDVLTVVYKNKHIIHQNIVLFSSLFFLFSRSGILNTIP